MNYSYHCKFCGFTSFSNDTKEIARVRESHQKTNKRLGIRKTCMLVPVSKHGRTVARPDLVSIIRKTNGTAKA